MRKFLSLGLICILYSSCNKPDDNQSTINLKNDIKNYKINYPVPGYSGCKYIVNYDKKNKYIASEKFTRNRLKYIANFNNHDLQSYKFEYNFKKNNLEIIVNLNENNKIDSFKITDGSYEYVTRLDSNGKVTSAKLKFSDKEYIYTFKNNVFLKK